MAAQNPPFESVCGDYVISDDASRFDVDALHDYLEAEAHWAQGRSRQTTALAVANSLVLGAYGPDGSMIGGARVVTDRATFGWITDLYVHAEHRGHGLGRALATAACEHPALATVKRLLLITRDAHELYRGLGFVEVPEPSQWMEYRPRMLEPEGLVDRPAPLSDGASRTQPACPPQPTQSVDRPAPLSDSASVGAAWAEAPEAPEVSGMSESDELLAHTSWQGSRLPDPRTAPVAHIALHLLGIVETEGPVTSERAYRLYIRSAGSSKVTQRAREPLDQALGRLTLRGQVEVEELDNAGTVQRVLRLGGASRVSVRELGERSLYEVPLNEVAELMRRKRYEVMRPAGGKSQPTHAVAEVVEQARLRKVRPDRLKRAVLDTYGLVRMTQAAEQYLSAALALLEPPAPASADNSESAAPTEPHQSPANDTYSTGVFVGIPQME